MSSGPSIELDGASQRPNISFNGRLLYSESSTPEKRVEGLPRTPQTLYIIASPLLFYGVDALLSIVPDNSEIAAVELDPHLYDFTRRIISPEISDRFHYMLIEKSGAQGFLESFNISRFRRITPVKLNRGYMLNRKEYDSFFSDASAAIESFWKNKMTTIHMGRLWCRNIFQNLPFINNSRPLSSVKTELPVISAGAGESLENSIDFLKSNRSGYFLVAADTAVSTLLDNGIKPDLTVIVESQHANLYDFYTPQALDLPAAFDLTSSPELVRKYRGPLYFFISEFSDCRFFSALRNAGLMPTAVPPLGSVGVTSLYISLMLTSRNVFYTGLDFSFIPDKYHSSGSPSHITGMMRETRLDKPGFFASAYNGRRSPTIDKSGRRVFTDLVMQSYSATLNELGAASGRLYDIGTLGLSSGNKILSEPEACLIISEGPCPEPDASSSLKRAHDAESFSTARTGSVKTYLEAEITKIDTAVKNVVGIRNSSVTALPEPVEQLLNELDYVWLFFPDNEPMPSASPSFLKRFLYSASWFRRQIENTLSGI